MKRDLLRVTIKLLLTQTYATDDHGTIAMLPPAYTLKALTAAVATVVRHQRAFTRREVLESLNDLMRADCVTYRTHRPSGERLFKWITDSDRRWAYTNGSNGWATYHRRSGSTSLIRETDGWTAPQMVRAS